MIILKEYTAKINVFSTHPQFSGKMIAKILNNEDLDYQYQCDLIDGEYVITKEKINIGSGK